MSWSSPGRGLDGSSNASGKRFSDRDITQNDGSGVEFADAFSGIPNSEASITNVTVLMDKAQESEGHLATDVWMMSSEAP